MMDIRKCTRSEPHCPAFSVHEVALSCVCGAISSMGSNHNITFYPFPRMGWSENCTLHAGHCTLHTTHCTLHTAHCTLQNSHWIHIFHCSLQPSHCIEYGWLSKKPQGKKSSITLDFCGTALTPTPLLSLDMFEELFFQPHIKQAKVPQKVWILVSPLPFLGKCPNFSWKGSL